jgi:cell division protein FtsQ
VTGQLRRWLVGAGLVLALLVGLGWLVGFSSVLGVRSVLVSGTRQLSPAEIETAAAVRPGSPLSRLDTAAIQARVAKLPGVRAVTVHTSYPSTVLIQVTERVAVGYRATPTGAGLVDADNVQFRIESRPPAGLPQLATARPGQADQAAATATVAGALPPELARKVSLISAASTETVTLRLFDGRQVFWGGTDRGADKARLMTALLRQPGRYYDISDPSTVISRSS